MSVSRCIMQNIQLKCRLFYDKIIANFSVKRPLLQKYASNTSFLIFIYFFGIYFKQTLQHQRNNYNSCLLKSTIFWATEILDQISVLQNSYRVSMATKDSIMKQSIFFLVIGHKLSFEYGSKKFLFGAWRNFSGALRELILNTYLLMGW